MKKYRTPLLLTTLALILLAAALRLTAAPSTAAAATRQSSTAKSEDKPSIVCTIFPEYDWVRQILGGEADQTDLTLLLGNGVDLHSYQPTAEDIMKVSSCDLFIYVGGESDSWVENALKEAVNKDMVVINLLDVLGGTVKEEEIVEGMDTKPSIGKEEPEADEHVWLSLKNAEILCTYIEQQLESLDAKNADAYRANTKAYLTQLDTLDGKYQAAVNNAKFHTLLFGDRFPFRYLVDDYDLDYYAAFAGCSAETEASFETIAFLSGKVDELGLTSVMTLEGSEHKIVETIIQNTADKNQTIRSLDSMQSTTTEDIDAGTTYLSIMESNFTVLKEALESI